MRFGFVILHYKNHKVTEDCIESIIINLKDPNDYKIVIVDNGSNNGSGEYLSKKYNSYEGIYFVTLNENLGFAKGNNIGIEKLREFNTDIFITLNSDTEIYQPNFLDLISKVYLEYNFDILGPDIINLDGLHQNPVKTYNGRYMIMVKDTMMDCANYLLSYLGLQNSKKRLFKRIGLTQKNSTLSKNIDHENFKMDIQLHGSCIIFSKKFIDGFKGFYFKTFLYGEEEILFYIVKKYHLISIYYPEIKISHKEGQSTVDEVVNQNKYRFFLKHHIYSRFVLIWLLVMDLIGRK